MIYSEDILNFFKKKKINFFCGVPDSVLKNFTNILSNKKNIKNIITHNEGGAVALAAGYHLKTKKIPVVYLQNSGLSNAINPLTSLTHKKVYSIPMCLLIGWRGAPNIKDEPQHQVKGKITKEILKLLNIKYCILEKKGDLLKLNKLINLSNKTNKPIACLIKNNKIKSKKEKKFGKIKQFDENKYSRFKIIKYKTKYKKIKIFSTTGYTSRELYKIRKDNNFNKIDFYNIGAMGHLSMIALGYTINSKQKNVICLDGDGSFLMHLGFTSMVNSHKNFKHIIFNNGVHESVGNQKTNINNIKLKKFSKSVGYINYFYADNFNLFKKKFDLFLKKNGPSLFEIKVPTGTLKNIPRPNNFKLIKNNFIKFK